MTNFQFNTRTESPFFNIFEETFGALNGQNRNRNRQQHGGFPFADVYVDEEKRKLIFEIAIAGYAKEDIDISIKESKLTVSCDKIKPDTIDDVKNHRFIEHRIAKRNFERVWTLGPQVFGTSGVATFENGILKIVFDLVEEDVTKIEIA